MAKSTAIEFAEEFLSRAFAVGSTEVRAALASRTFALHVDTSHYIGELIAGAFLAPINNIEPEFHLHIWGAPGELPDLSWANNLLHGDQIVPEQQTPGFRIAFDRNQGMILVFDIERRVGAIWLRSEKELNYASFITPFRLMLSWFALTFGAEIIHASAVEVAGRGLLINGPSGSGKSTLALLALQNGGSILCDDVALSENGVIHAVYSRGKVLRSENLIDLTGIESFELPNGGVGKSIIPLDNFGEKFKRVTPLSAIVLPIIANVGAYEVISPELAFTLMAPNSLREIMGGTPKNYLQLKRVINSVPTYRLALSGDYARDYSALNEIASELS